jgi:hypothetical protein
MPSSTIPAGPPDVAEAARRAVVTFLHDAATATAERQSGRGAAAAGDPAGVTVAAPGVAQADASVPDEPIQWSPPAGARLDLPESVAVRAAAAGAATLERIEQAAAKVEADIAAALQAHAELQAGAGAAAEAAVRAAQEAWVSASSAAESERQAKISLRRVVRWVAVTIVLVAIMAGLLIASAANSR